MPVDAGVMRIRPVQASVLPTHYRDAPTAHGTVPQAVQRTSQIASATFFNDDPEPLHAR